MRSPVTLGPFELRAPIARGGMGEVWLAAHRERRLEVAVKVMTGQQVRKPRGLEAFRNEVRAVAGLDHPAIVRVFDHGEVSADAAAKSRGRLTAGTPYLVMELVRGGSLRNVQPRNWLELRSALLELLEALAHAHARGVIHRDLKPGNVLVAAADESGAGLRVSDFGLAALVDDPSLPLRSRFIMGTLQYMAPEQVAGRLRDIGPWTDLYSLGCIAWRLATGARAFESHDTRELIKMQMEAPPPPFLPVLPVPPGLEGWLLRLLHKDQARRYQRAGDAAWALLQLGEATGDRVELPIDDDLHSSGSYKRLSGGRPLSWTGWTSQVWSAPDRSVSALRRHVDAIGDADASDTDTEDETVGSLGQSTMEVVTSDRTDRGWTDPLPPLPLDWRMLRRKDHEPAPLGVGLGLLGLRSTPLIGRLAERDLLWSALGDVVRAGSTRAVLVTGPSGIGKTRLLRWLAESAHETGHATVLRATHSQIQGTMDGLGPMVGRHLGCIGLSPAEVTQRVRRVLGRIGVDDPWEWAAVAQIVAPGQAEPAPGAPVVRFGSPAERFAVLRRVIDYEARHRPVLLWLDDLQWSETSAEFVELLLEEHAGRPLLILGTVRSSPTNAPWVQRLLDGPYRTVIELPPLPRAAQDELLQSLLGLAPRVASEVLRRTEGRPLFASQLLGDWVRRGVLEATSDGYVVPDAELALPDTVESLQARRLERALQTVTGAGREAVELAAALGRSVSTAEWEAACAHAGVSVPADLVGALVEDGLASREPGGWRFTHNALRDAIEQHADQAGRWPAWNRAVFETLQEQLDLTLPESAERLARQALVAGLLADGLTWLEAAARALRGQGSYDRAAAPRGSSRPLRRACRRARRWRACRPPGVTSKAPRSRPGSSSSRPGPRTTRAPWPRTCASSGSSAGSRHGTTRPAPPTGKPWRWTARRGERPTRPAACSASASSGSAATETWSGPTRASRRRWACSRTWAISAASSTCSAGSRSSRADGRTSRPLASCSGAPSRPPAPSGTDSAR